MKMNCPFCSHETGSAVLVCSSCARDIAVPISLIAERDDLVRKLEDARNALSKMQDEITSLSRVKKRSRT
jgi:hypothetical protein